MQNLKPLGKYCIHRTVYQPVMSLHSGMVYKLEALSRFFNSQGEALPVFDVIKGLENTGGIKAATHLVIDSIVNFLVKLNDKKVSFNLSHLLLGDYETIDYLISKCLKYSLYSRNVEVEINENITPEDLIIHLNFLDYIKDCGLQIALDDFGIGMLQEKDLKNYKFDTIKIDRDIVNGIGKSRIKYERFLQILFFCLDSASEVICEGIEDIEDLKMIPCCEKIGIQGFVFSGPLSEYDVITLFSAK
ncbi:EAL domain-containing protein [Brenneria goodwinii]|uniref:EAL domain-containing protein n=1 Tax=Brenneria goodwinii TaxID=1109412 RepID=UPI0009E4843D|nr:EAL domain-containing protein [Brenneria goodwinii]MCG8155714.1 EAL domain-containing protein [Brenneria goodwinii]MCG8160546.1 EAL domain-containing protein [Brenneria goodwinii]MCG8166352.1 EAL domain-containing protein [Brenneria goodwinii]MCG8171086.1 EAL domain-containing protein [Brenneria goodwinii]MCG8176156.1 EAL domain-containing protein [Brenneria goodwinii]